MKSLVFLAIGATVVVSARARKVASDAAWGLAIFAVEFAVATAELLEDRRNRRNP